MNIYKTLFTLLFFTVAFNFPIAHAQQRVCTQSVTNQQLTYVLDEVDNALDQGKLTTAAGYSDQIFEEIFPCMDELVEPDVLGRYAQQLAIINYLSKDETAAVRWGHLATFVAPGLRWRSIGPVNVLTSLIYSAGVPELGGPVDKGLIPPYKGGIFHNGSLLTEPLVPIEVPGLIQIADKRGQIIETYWQDGAAFSPSILGETKQLEAPRWHTAPTKAGLIASKVQH